MSNIELLVGNMLLSPKDHVWYLWHRRKGWVQGIWFSVQFKTDLAAKVFFSLYLYFQWNFVIFVSIWSTEMQHWNEKATTHFHFCLSFPSWKQQSAPPGSSSPGSCCRSSTPASECSSPGFPLPLSSDDLVYIDTGLDFTYYTQPSTFYDVEPEGGPKRGGTARIREF